MKWEGNRQSDNVEDRRSSGGSFGVGGRGIGVGSVVIALVAWGVFGINPLTTLGLLAGSGQTQVAHQAPARQPPANDRKKPCRSPPPGSSTCPPSKKHCPA